MRLLNLEANVHRRSGLLKTEEEIEITPSRALGRDENCFCRVETATVTARSNVKLTCELRWPAPRDDFQTTLKLRVDGIKIMQYATLFMPCATCVLNSTWLGKLVLRTE